ncbi:hypothetical protein EVG20_g10652 [Dentipellis fragilis]|uniref:Rhodanese domain-containing protein n=1 Tax=Dentipellis fragilis TaxID=205917 RepID=A0A4Y9XPI3_9AGAM|nr:hypothetical protein EVG20_g10652 [Dentipellis fragilis]
MDSESPAEGSGLAHLDDYRRYGRQMILDGFGLPGQLKLQKASVVVVGAGGLGCPALQYLAAAGVGRIGIIDHDVVELSNLQRQILHNESRLGMPKAQSAATALKEINSRIRIDTITEALSASNAVPLLSPYDIILDCTDNAPTRYLLSDTAVHLGKPLVSGAAQKYDGQLCVYHLGDDGPCYRCLFPKPPAPELAGSCAETGILGAVTGVIGNLQALEAIKIITGLHGETPSNACVAAYSLTPPCFFADGNTSLLIYSALSFPPFRSIRLRKRRPTCPACGVEGQKVGKIKGVDYVQFCGGARPDWETLGLVPGIADTRIRASELKSAMDAKDVRIIDVRPKTEYGICHIPSSIHVPINELVADPTKFVVPDAAYPAETYVVCRLGNDSQIAASALREANPSFVVKDLIGGLQAWSRDVDSSFPIY